MLEFENTSIYVQVGDTFTLMPLTNVEGENVIDYTIGDGELLSYSEGVFTALKAGTTTILAKLKDYPNVQVTITVTIEEQPDDDTDHTVIRIQYVLNSGYFTEEVRREVKRSELPFTLPTASRDGYQFVGWYDNPDFNGDYVTSLTDVTDDEVTLYAHWVMKYEYSIAYELDGGENSPLNPVKYTIYDLPIRLEQPTKPGYIFRGWFLDQNYRHGPIEELSVAKNYHLYALWESTVSQEQVLIDSSLTDTEPGTVITYRGIDYVFGTNAFATLSEGLQVAEKLVYLVGEFDESVTITKSNLTLLGPNAGINPNTEKREPEVTIKGTITLANNVSNITFDGLSFTEQATITGSLNRNINFVNNYVYNTREPVSEWQETAGYKSGFMTFHSSVNDGIINLLVKNNRFENVPDVNLNFSRITNIHVEGNVFKNFERDAIRFDDGGFNQGELLFLNNRFENDSLGGYNGIYFRIYGGDEKLPTTIRIEGNYFKNIGNPHLTQYSGAISMRNYQEKSTSIIIEFNEFDHCANFIHVRNNGKVTNHQNFPWSGRINYNIFRGIPIHYYHKNWTGSDEASTNPPTMDFQYNYFEDNAGQPITDPSLYDDKILHVSSYANHYISYASYEAMLEGLTIRNIQILNRIDQLSVGDVHQFMILIEPVVLQDQPLTITSSNPNVITITDNNELFAVAPGKVTITIQSATNPDVKLTMDIVVPDTVGLMIDFDGPNAVSIGESLQLKALVRDGREYEYEWTSSNPNLATVDAQGKVTGLAEGEVDITVTIKGTEKSFTVRLLIYDDTKLSDILKFFLLNHRGIIDRYSIYYIGSNDGSADYLNSFYLSVNHFLFEELNIIRNMIPETNENYSGITMPSLEFITIHDTANTNSSAGAQANSNWAKNPANTGSSWHYTVGNDGVYQQLEDHIVGWHAGDGSRQFQLIDTGVKATSDNPVVTINERGFYSFDGVESKILAPAVAQITPHRLFVTIGENGNYWMNATYFNSTYQMVVNQGGNYNSIGIETAVNNGSDIHWTWQRTAKLVAYLLDQHQLGLDRVMFHNSFSGKICPRTMLTAGLEEEFFNLVRAEYEFQKYFSEYTIQFTSHNPELLGDNGRLLTTVNEPTVVSYTITVTHGEETQSITLQSIILPE